MNKVCLPEWNNHVRIDLIEVTTWLVEKYGHSSLQTWVRGYNRDEDCWEYTFRDQDIATLFALRWS